MASLEKFGQNLARIRKEKGLTQEDLAGMAEVDRSYLSELENGHKNPSFRILEKIANALDVNISQILKN